MITIRGIMFGERKIGIALHKLMPGENEFEIDVVDKNGDRLYPGTFVIIREEAIEKYGVNIINKKNLEGIWLPLANLERKEEPCKD